MGAQECDVYDNVMSDNTRYGVFFYRGSDEAEVRITYLEISPPRHLEFLRREGTYAPFCPNMELFFLVRYRPYWFYEWVFVVLRHGAYPLPRAPSVDIPYYT